MLAWTDITPALKSLFGDLAFAGVVPPAGAQWHDQKRQFTHQGTQTDLLLQVTNVRQPVGEDARTFETVGSGGAEELHEVLSGDRIVTLNVRVESMRQDHERWAWDTIERIRTRLGRLSSHDRLRAVNVAILRTLAATGLPAPRDGRVMSVATMDVLLGIGFRDVDTSGALSWIERVELTGQAKDTDGTQLPSSLNTTSTVAPFEG